MRRSESDEKDGEIGHTIVVVEEPSDLNAKDDAAIVAMMTGQAIEEYVYSFKQGGRVVEGLTLAGINEAANRRGGIQVEDVKFEDRENSWLAIVKATDTYTGNSRFGAYEQPKKSGGREDPFAFTKAIHKAQRNAIKQLIPTPVIRDVMNFYLGRSDRAPTALPPSSEPAPAEQPDAITTHQKAAFSVAQKLREPLDKRGVSQRDFWNYVRRRFHVQSRNEMREEQWAELAAELQAASTSKDVFADFAAGIERVLRAERDAGIPETAPGDAEPDMKESPTTESESPVKPKSGKNPSVRGRRSAPRDGLF